MSMNSQTWRVGELAEAAGLTVRTLHHYDRIGLLCPSLRNEGGHRVYTGDDARRLFQIVALRGLGLTLGQIQDCLTKKLDPRPLLAEQVRTLSAQIESGGRLRTRLLSLLEVLEQRNEPDGHDLLQLIQQTVDVGRLVSEYLTVEQTERMTHRHAELGPLATALIRDELPNLYRQALAAYRTDADPSDPTVRAIVERIDTASATLSGGDDSVTSGVRRMWAERGEEVYPGSGVPWRELVEFLDRARTVGSGRPADPVRR